MVSRWGEVQVLIIIIVFTYSKGLLFVGGQVCFLLIGILWCNFCFSFAWWFRNVHCHMSFWRSTVTFRGLDMSLAHVLYEKAVCANFWTFNAMNFLLHFHLCSSMKILSGTLRIISTVGLLIICYSTYLMKCKSRSDNGNQCEESATTEDSYKSLCLTIFFPLTNKWGRVGGKLFLGQPSVTWTMDVECELAVMDLW